jgi:3-hydroxybutyryl-CoA dehydrogenase
MIVKNVRNICVIGAGNMGHQIAIQAALSGFKAKCTDINQSTLTAAREFAEKWLNERVSKGKITPELAAATRQRLLFTPDLEEAAGDADLVIEAIIEILEAKRDLFSRLDTICPPHTIFATNSSFIVSSKIADVTNRPDKFLNMHYFNPALVMKLVEVVKGPHVSEETVETVMGVCQALGKVPVRVNKEIYGFIVNRIFSAMTKEACYLLDQEVANVEDIDLAVKNGLGHPMGPFQVLDLTGIDLEYNILMERYRTTGDLGDKPSPAIVKRYALQHYGKKTKRGFYEYN